ncbi:hypothetical protein PIN17_A1826 [Prevotella intermedia 17]|nr:hypothetical protein PIN17_A1826 [Prevotella intermedia 17]
MQNSRFYLAKPTLLQCESVVFAALYYSFLRLSYLFCYHKIE